MMSSWAGRAPLPVRDLLRLRDGLGGRSLGDAVRARTMRGITSELSLEERGFLRLSRLAAPVQG
jgi:hypothetical protein